MKLSVTPEETSALMARASQARQEGRTDEATRLAQELVVREPSFGPAWNLLGILQLEGGKSSEAVQSLNCAVKVDPDPPFGWFNLAKAQRALGDRLGELQSLDSALTRDPYFLPAILAKGEVLRALHQESEALELYRLLLEGLEDTSSFPQAIQAQLVEARDFLRRDGLERLGLYLKELDKVAARYPSGDLLRARAYVENRAGMRRVYLQTPTAGHFPYLPAIEFFDRELFPWFEELERRTDDIRQELLSLWAEDDPNFRPYVAREPGAPLGEWKELNHSPRWSAYFLWENGARNDTNCARCPITTAAIEATPLLDIPGKAPTAMFSVLKSRTRIPPHTGSTNARTTIHLPLVVPPGCRFRVGAETRDWREGECWAFDDTIEHEAWNDSDSPRAILIIDGWNPLLSEAEREAVRLVG